MIMSKITAITVQANNKERCNVYVDGEFFAGVLVEAVMTLKLKPGAEADEKTLNALKDFSARAEALSKAAGYISKSLKTKRQVKDYLLRRGYDYRTAADVVEKLSEKGYINDALYAEKYIESTKATQGRRLASFKLMQKGVKKSDIETVYENEPFTQEEDARKIAEKRLRGKEITKELLSKTFRYLVGRGFSYEEAEYALKDFRGEGFW